MKTIKKSIIVLIALIIFLVCSQKNVLAAKETYTFSAGQGDYKSGMKAISTVLKNEYSYSGGELGNFARKKWKAKFKITKVSTGAFGDKLYCLKTINESGQESKNNITNHNKNGADSHAVIGLESELFSYSQLQSLFSCELQEEQLKENTTWEARITSRFS